MKALNAHTNDELRTRINKGQAMLDTAHGILFVAWTTKYMAQRKRTVSKFTKTDLVAAYGYIAGLYRAQQELAVDEAFDVNTLSFVERSRYRARQIKSAAEVVKQLIVERAPTNKINAAKAKVKSAMSFR